MLKKLGVLIFMICAAGLAAGLYGALHNQLSYSISQEYFTKFKFDQFGIPWAFDSPRLGAAYIGFIASWWVGALICLILGGVSYSFDEPKALALALAKSFFLVIFAAFFMGVLGLVCGYYFINDQTTDAYAFLLKEDINEPVHFLRVGLMHNSGYLGGVMGLLIGIMYLLASKRRLKLG